MVGASANLQVTIPAGQPFDLKLTLECGQGHRWRKDGDWFTSVLGDDFVRIRQESKHEPLEYDCGVIKQPNIEDWLRCQFRLKDDDEDVRVAYAHLECNPQMEDLVQDYYGLRVMRVNPWESLVFFILSGGFGRESTKTIVNNIARAFGKPGGLDGHFDPVPTALEIVVDDKEGLDTLTSLYQKKGLQILDAAKEDTAGELQLDDLANLPDTENAISKLMKLKGVKDKVANCIALFGLEKLDAFPVDTNIESALNCRYGSKFGLPTDLGAMRKWAQYRFGLYAGYASQFLFLHGDQYHGRNRAICPYQSSTE